MLRKLLRSLLEAVSSNRPADVEGAGSPKGAKETIEAEEVERRDRQSLACSGFFDADWYFQSYPDAAASGLDALGHYQQFGWRQGRSPGPNFDAAWYLANNPDVAAAGDDPLLHYVLHGEAEGRRLLSVSDALHEAQRPAAGKPEGEDDDDAQLIGDSGFFDPQWYLDFYPGVATTEAEALAHYRNLGWREGKSPGPDFDGAWYLAQNPDVAAAGQNPLEHYARHGALEGRRALSVREARALAEEKERSEEDDRQAILRSKLFDADWYIRTYPEVAASGMDALAHYRNLGWREGKSPGPGFDGAWYLAQNPDVAAAGQNPLEHYARHGALEGRRALSVREVRALAEEKERSEEDDRQAILKSKLFDAGWYIRTYPEVAASGMDALAHYRSVGWREGKSPGPGFDGAWYLARNPDVAAGGAEPLLHYVRHGAAEGRKLFSADEWRALLAVSRRTLASLGDLDAGFYASESYTDLQRLEVTDGKARCRASRAVKLLLDGFDRAYDHLIFVPWLVHGGADLVAANAAKACAKFSGGRSTLVVVADHDRVRGQGMVAAGCRCRRLQFTGAGPFAR